MGVEWFRVLISVAGIWGSRKETRCADREEVMLSLGWQEPLKGFKCREGMLISDGTMTGWDQGSKEAILQKYIGGKCTGIGD